MQLYGSATERQLLHVNSRALLGCVHNPIRKAHLSHQSDRIFFQDHGTVWHLGASVHIKTIGIPMTFLCDCETTVHFLYLKIAVMCIRQRVAEWVHKICLSKPFFSSVLLSPFTRCHSIYLFVLLADNRNNPKTVKLS